ncbi:hypothetical protein EJ08DRAFT_568531, partial [Tothia fuscella]
KLTQINETELTNGIFWDQLPATIRDAVLVCRRINIQFLWVDSLCIMQDNASDLAHNLAQMPEVYKRAHVTIAASVAASCREGFLSTRLAGARSRDLLKLRHRSRDGAMGSQFVLHDEGKKIVGSGPLEKRAWALQERLLSQRFLSFAFSQLSWRCNTSTPSSDFVDGWRHPDSNRTVMLGKEKTLESWVLLVKDYSARSLTDSGDRLAAVAAIAEEFGDALKDEYVAGLWKRSLPARLLWTSGCRMPRPLSYIASTWSWASVQRDILWLLDHPNLFTVTMECHIELLKCHTEPVHQNVPYGTLKSGHIILR